MTNDEILNLFVTHIQPSQFGVDRNALDYARRSSANHGEQAHCHIRLHQHLIVHQCQVLWGLHNAYSTEKFPSLHAFLTEYFNNVLKEIKRSERAQSHINALKQLPPTTLGDLGDEDEP